MSTFLLVIIYLAFISLGLPDSLLGSAWPVMQPELGASFASAGIVSMIVAGGTIVSSLASGKVLQKLGTGKVTLISCMLTAGALIGFFVSSSLGMLAILAIPLGLGAGSVDAGLNHYVAANYKAHHMNWLHCFWGVGATMGPIIMSASIASYDSWRGGYIAVSMIQLMLIIVLFFTLPLWDKVALSKNIESPPIHIERGSNLQEKKTGGNVLNIEGVKASLIAFFLYCGVESTVGLWGASYLAGAHRLPAETAAGWISLYYGGITLGRLITGFFALKVSNKILIRYGQIIAVTGGIIILLPLPVALILPGFILLGLGLAPVFPGLLHETPARFGMENSGKLIGYQMAVAYTGTTLLPPIFGALAEKTDIAALPFVVLIFLVLKLLSVEKVNLILRKKQQKFTCDSTV